MDKKNTTSFQDECYSYIADFAERIYENEMRREQNLIQQASHMQSVFSFIIAALFVLVPVIVNLKDIISAGLIIGSFASITFSLLLSLFFATMAQNRKKRADFPTVEELHEKIKQETNLFLTEAQRKKFLTETYEKIQKDCARINNRRALYVQLSMYSFYGALVLCACWFIILICIAFIGG